jgi:hypothetical protein
MWAQGLWVGGGAVAARTRVNPSGGAIWRARVPRNLVPLGAELFPVPKSQVAGDCPYAARVYVPVA